MFDATLSISGRNTYGADGMVTDKYKLIIALLFWCRHFGLHQRKVQVVTCLEIQRLLKDWV